MNITRPKIELIEKSKVEIKRYKKHKYYYRSFYFSIVVYLFYYLIFEKNFKIFLVSELFLEKILIHQWVFFYNMWSVMLEQILNHIIYYLNVLPLVLALFIVWKASNPTTQPAHFDNSLLVPIYYHIYTEKIYAILQWLSFCGLIWIFKIKFPE